MLKLIYNLCSLLYIYSTVYCKLLLNQVSKVSIFHFKYKAAFLLHHVKLYFFVSKCIIYDVILKKQEIVSNAVKHYNVFKIKIH